MRRREQYPANLRRPPVFEVVVLRGLWQIWRRSAAHGRVRSPRAKHSTSAAHIEPRLAKPDRPASWGREFSLFGPDVPRRWK
ncbi:hypothetical protein NDU88_000992 [Pleurodeles waltl]|uniref:Uncharacterized protein n=1 Tax=Pleurodeles waltl TaxID=8319 RepID=A0AAV7U5P0_PLEWA|nr:hypothetical protein NDU88_000992 [Pleurodeles waltl]